MDDFKKLIDLIEKERSSKVICYVTGDRPGAPSQIGEDAVRIIYEHLLAIGKVSKISLVLYSRGGDVSVPWRIVSMIREFCDTFEVVIPYRAQSAATLIALGADVIVMGKKAELGPVDPSLTQQDGSTFPTSISIEDVKSYLSFIKRRAGITDQMALSQNVAILTERLGPNVLGQIERTDNHIRFVARQLLVARKEKIEEARINSIVEILTEKIYHHGHAIGRREAKEIGLPIETPGEKLEKLIWDLYLAYERRLFLLSPLFAEELLVADSFNLEEKTVNVEQAIIESLSKRSIFESELLFKREREILPNLQVNIPINLQLPSDVDLNLLSEQQKGILQNLVDEVNKIAPKIVYNNILSQMPEIGIKTIVLRYNWGEK